MRRSSGMRFQSIRSLANWGQPLHCTRHCMAGRTMNCCLRRPLPSRYRRRLLEYQSHALVAFCVGDPVDTPYSYARSHNPTWTSLEKTIGQMESTEDYRASALVFASGMAACTAVFGAVLRPGDVAVLPSNAYYTARVLMQEYFTKM